MSDDKMPLNPAWENLIDMLIEQVLDELEAEQKPELEGGAK